MAMLAIDTRADEIERVKQQTSVRETGTFIELEKYQNIGEQLARTVNLRPVVKTCGKRYVIKRYKNTERELKICNRPVYGYAIPDLEMYSVTLGGSVLSHYRRSRLMSGKLVLRKVPQKLGREDKNGLWVDLGARKVADLRLKYAKWAVLRALFSLDYRPLLEEGYHVNHIDGDKLNCHPNNLCLIKSGQRLAMDGQPLEI